MLKRYDLTIPTDINLSAYVRAKKYHALKFLAKFLDK
jgi:hypothetical protein